MVDKYICIGAAAIVGTSLRAGIGVIASGADFPYSILLINIIASFALVVLYEVFREYEIIDPLLITSIGTGLIGSFSTMSAVAYDTLAFMQAELYKEAALNYTLNMTLCLLAAIAGWKVSKAIVGKMKLRRKQ